MTIDKSKTLEKTISAVGNTIRIVREDGTELRGRALVQNAWTRQHLRYDRHAAEPGRYSSRYWLYIGPPSLDITVLNDGDTLYCDRETYYFIQQEAVKMNDTVQYYRGILKKAEEDDDVFISGD